mmetsp:Transcript_16254/g.32347  ORF Transcript_16254/g.32347 Transcript_16254/m.32347 type:complete len:104 (-) Transcript_16254:17-328(-)
MCIDKYVGLVFLYLPSSYGNIIQEIICLRHLRRIFEYPSQGSHARDVVGRTSSVEGAVSSLDGVLAVLCFPALLLLLVRAKRHREIQRSLPLPRTFGCGRGGG